jgi:hypothetical protein
MSRILRSLFAVLLLSLTLLSQTNSTPKTATLSWKDSKGAEATAPLSGVPLCTLVTVYVNPDSKTKVAGQAVALSVESGGAPLTSGTIEIRDTKSKSTTPLLTIQLKKDGTSGALTGLSAGEHDLTATLVGDDQSQASSTASKMEVDVESPSSSSASCITQMPPIILTIVGLNVEAASSTSPQATFLGNVSLDFPFSVGTTLAKPMADIRKAHFFLTGSLRLAGMAQPGTLSASAFTSSYYASAVNSTPDKIVQSWEGSISASIVFKKMNWKLGTFDEGTPPSADYPATTLVTESLIATAGFDSPLSASQANPPVYYATTQIQQEFTPTSGPWPASCAVTTGSNPPCYVSFIPADRARFYRYYEAGVRLRLYGEDFTRKMLRAPGVVDITVGQNEYVTGGGLKGVVAHLAGIMPIPIPKVDGFYAFGSIASELNGQVGNGNQLLLIPVPSTANVNYLSNSVYDVSVSQPNRDRYRFGFGIDLYKLLSNAKQKTDTSGTGSTPSESTPSGAAGQTSK